MIIKNGKILIGEELVNKDIRIEGEIITEIADEIIGDNVIDVNGAWVLPSATDVHVHLREPGFEYKETVATGTLASAKGGVGTIMSMPNLRPCPDSVEHLKLQLDAIAKDAVVKVYPYAAVTVNEDGKELADLDALAPYVLAFTDDGKGVNNLELLRKAMQIAKDTGKVVASHAEAEGYGFGREAEIIAVEREIKMAEEIGCKYHFCHISTAEAYDFIRQAKERGVDVTVEVTPHHLLLNDGDIKDGNTKMNPPLRPISDMIATVQALLDG
ncbi:MAG: amidohydrolase family protein, partial [Clostridia bacterium]|nr:amidohydrolase family protein [Clostridia bacterium]